MSSCGHHFVVRSVLDPVFDILRDPDFADPWDVPCWWLVALSMEIRSVRERIDGMVPGLLDLPEGCRFENRCTFSREQCISNTPGLQAITVPPPVRCLRWQEL